MRKRTMLSVADTVSWYIIYFLPMICYLLYLFVQPGSVNQTAPLNFSTFLVDIGLNIANDNIVVNSLSGMFGANGTLPMFQTDTVFVILTWFVASYLCHLAIDFLLFLPRLCHKWLDSFSK